LIWRISGQQRLKPYNRCALRNPATIPVKQGIFRAGDKFGFGLRHPPASRLWSFSENTGNSAGLQAAVMEKTMALASNFKISVKKITGKFEVQNRESKKSLQ
jgi:hypothetical protein